MNSFFVNGRLNWDYCLLEAALEQKCGYWSCVYGYCDAVGVNWSFVKHLPDYRNEK